MSQKINYNVNHSYHASIAGFIMPVVVSLFLSIIILVGNIDNQNKIFQLISSLVVESSFLIFALAYSKIMHISFDYASGIKNKISPSTAILAICMSIGTLVLLNPIISYWEQLLKLLNFNLASALPIALDSVGNLLLAILCFALVPAICEEALFRGVLLNGLRKQGAVCAISISAMMFSLMHLNIQQLPYTFLLGILFGIVVYYTRCLWLSMVMHFANNAIVLILNYCLPDFDIGWWYIVIAIIGVILFATLIYLLVRMLDKKYGKNNLNQNQAVDTVKKLTPKEFHKKFALAYALGVFCLIIYTLQGFGVL